MLFVNYDFFEKERTLFSTGEFSVALMSSGHGTDHKSYPVVCIQCNLLLPAAFPPASPPTVGPV